jgi:hypothetical protein
MHDFLIRIATKLEDLKKIIYALADQPKNGSKLGIYVIRFNIFVALYGKIWTHD